MIYILCAMNTYLLEAGRSESPAHPREDHEFLSLYPTHEGQLRHPPSHKLRVGILHAKLDVYAWSFCV
jgi:hypothetical protein